jgi:hypothetical protein
VGALLGVAAISEYPAALFAGLAFLWALAEARDRRVLIGVVLGGLPPLVLLAAYNWAIFDTMFPVGYRYHVEYRDVHAQGFMGIAGPRWSAFRGVTLLTMVIIGFLLYVSSYRYWWGGSSIGPRFLVPVVPFFMLAGAAAVDQWLSRPLTCWALLALTAWSVMGVWSQSVAGQRYPPWEFRWVENLNPTFQGALPLLREGDVAVNYGSLLGLRGLASLLPLAVAVALLLWAAKSRRIADDGSGST